MERCFRVSEGLLRDGRDLTTLQISCRQTFKSFCLLPLKEPTSGVLMWRAALSQDEYSPIDLTVVCADGSKSEIPGNIHFMQVTAYPANPWSAIPDCRVAACLSER